MKADRKGTSPTESVAKVKVYVGTLRSRYAELK